MPTASRILLPLLTLALLLPAARLDAQSSTAAPAATPARPPAAPAPALAGDWSGTLRAGPIAATLRLTFAPDGNGRHGTARVTPDGPQPELTGEIRELVVGEREITFSVATQEGTMRFTGTRDGSGGLTGRLQVVNDGGAVEARGVWSARVDTAAAPAQRRLTELTRLLAAGDRAALLGYVDSAYDGRTLRRAPRWYADQLAHLRRDTQGLQLDSVELATPRAVTARFRARVSDVPLTLGVEVDSLPPHRVTAFRTKWRYRHPASPPPRWLAHDEMVRELETTVGRLAAADLFSGVVLLARDDSVLLARAYGMASREHGVPNTLETRFRLGSMTKMLTAVAIAQLAERGRLGLDDPLSRWLPDFPDPAAARAIRIEHLLTHTSGLGDYLTPRLRQRAPRLRTVDDRIAAIRADSGPLLFEPGTAWTYSNVGYVLLAKVVELASGEDYFDYVRRHVLEPAGMRHSAFVDFDDDVPGLATGYSAEATDGGWVFHEAPDMPGTRSGPDGNSIATAHDMHRFARALREHRLLGPAYTRLALSPKPELGAPAWGYGFAVDSLRRMVGHGGGAPGVETEFDMFPETGYTIVVLANHDASARPVWRALWDVVAASPEARRLASAPHAR